MGIATALLTQAASTGAGVLANELFNREADVPDFSAEVKSEFDRRRQELAEVMDRNQKEVQANLAASGRTGSAGASARQGLFGESAEAYTDLAAKEAAEVARAQNRERRAQFQQDQRKTASRAQALSNIFGRGGQILALQQLGGEGEENDDGGGGGGGNGGGSAPGASAPPVGGGGGATQYLSNDYSDYSAPGT